ncbi:hypothetical protein SLEP1_g8447 [Rubroshorea leprosula]|uniref:Partial AB-hydrolase lipase domain-containing protein n=1 Tax=Rubroshorea leprosula TaxID=152421 RepID=A0AAV5ICN1_9ROSI|nr:hypothetical protein SLEP1_g8447 [Rubroshorea leprosula]
MMQRAVDNVLAVTKESVKTFTFESLNNIVRFINGLSALLLTILPGKANILEGFHGWELRPTFRGPRFPRWMEKGASSFNQFIHELSVDSDTSSVDYSSGEEDDHDGIYPLSPTSQSSRVSRTSTQGNCSWHWTDWIAYIFSWILLPAKFLFGVPFHLFHVSYMRQSRAPATPRSPRPLHFHSIKKPHAPKDHVVYRTTDRRRGVIEDLHLAIEIFIEAIFDMFHKAAYFLLSPTEAFKIIHGWFTSLRSDVKDVHPGVSDAYVTSTTLGSDDPAVTERKMTIYQSLNTDARTCQDVITEMGYPYEAIHVITSDGYVLHLERIPRRDARKAVYLQHGIFDSSMW